MRSRGPGADAIVPRMVQLSVLLVFSLALYCKAGVRIEMHGRGCYSIKCVSEQKKSSSCGGLSDPNVVHVGVRR